MSATQSPVPVLTGLLKPALVAETTYGTEVATGMQALGSVSINPKPKISTEKFTARGFRLPTALALSEKMAEHGFEGIATYTELAYFLKTLASGASAAVDSYTLAAGGKMYPGAVVSGVSLKGDNKSVKLSGSMLSKWFTATAVPTPTAAPEQYAIDQNEVVIGLGTSAATTLTRWFNWGLDISDIISLMRFGGQLEPGAAANPESCSIKFSVEFEANSTNLAFLGNIGTMMFWAITCTKSGQSVAIVGKGMITDIQEYKDNQGVYGYGVVVETMASGTGLADGITVTIDSTP